MSLAQLTEIWTEAFSRNLSYRITDTDVVAWTTSICEDWTESALHVSTPSPKGMATYDRPKPSEALME